MLAIFYCCDDLACMGIKFFANSRSALIIGMLVVVLFGLVAFTYRTYQQVGPCGGESYCLTVDGIAIRSVRYNGVVVPLGDSSLSGATTLVVPPLSRDVGYVWAFDSVREAEEFNLRLDVLERRCWVPAAVRSNSCPFIMWR
jgi:hypothetical protein